MTNCSIFGQKRTPVAPRPRAGKLRLHGSPDTEGKVGCGCCGEAFREFMVSSLERPEEDGLDQINGSATRPARGAVPLLRRHKRIQIRGQPVQGLPPLVWPLRFRSGLTGRLRRRFGGQNWTTCSESGLGGCGSKQPPESSTATRPAFAVRDSCLSCFPLVALLHFQSHASSLSWPSSAFRSTRGFGIPCRPCRPWSSVGSCGPGEGTWTCHGGYLNYRCCRSRSQGDKSLGDWSRTSRGLVWVC